MNIETPRGAVNDTAILGSMRPSSSLETVKLTPAPDERVLLRVWQPETERVLPFLYFAKILLTIVVVGACVAVAVFVLNDDTTPERRVVNPSPVPQPLPRAGDSGMATTNGQCSHVGETILEEGGNAADAVVASALCLTVVHPFSTSLGGDGVLTISQPTAEGPRIHRVLDFRGYAPASADTATFAADPSLLSSGVRSVLVPTMVRGLKAILARFGTKQLNEVIEPSIRLARDGFVVSRFLAHALQNHQGKITGTALFSVFSRNGALVAEGDTVTWEAMAVTLERVAEGGVAFYESDEFTSDLNWAGITNRIISQTDMGLKSPTIRNVTKANLFGHTILTPPAPMAGPMITLASHILEYGHTIETTDSSHLVSEASKFMFGHQNRVGQVKSVTDHEELLEMIAPAYGQELGDTLQVTTNTDLSFYGEVPGEHSIPSNVLGQASVMGVDQSGTVASLGLSLGSVFGSGIVLPSSHVILNNGMSEFSLDEADLNLVEASKSPRSYMCPTVVLNGATPILSLGNAGGAGGVTGLLWTLNNLFTPSGTSSLAEAIDKPRTHHQLNPNSVLFESTLPKASQVFLTSSGHTLVPDFPEYLESSPLIGSVLGLSLNSADGAVDKREVA